MSPLFSNLSRCEETKKEFNDYWNSTKSKIVNLESHLGSILPVHSQFNKEQEQSEQLNSNLNVHLEDEKSLIDNLI